MAAPRILQAAREILKAALTGPLMYYTDLGGGTGYSLVELPPANVVPRAIWNLDTPAPPCPYVCFAVEGHGSTSRYIADRRMTVTFWVVTEDEDQCTEVYEAIRTIVNFGDQDAGFFATDQSRIGSSTELGAIFRELIETRAHAPDYDRTTARWQLVAEYSAIAA